MFVISPWSKGGWVDSEVFDHTSVIRFLEARFGVREPNISPWRRAVCGDLTSAFDFADPDNSDFSDELPDTEQLAELARALPGTIVPPAPAQPSLPEQETCARPSRALPYELHVTARVRHAPAQVELRFGNTGRAGAVFHVYDRYHLDREPRRYTVEAGKHLTGAWDVTGDAGRYDLWVLGPNGFHRHVAGRVGAHSADPEIAVDYARGDLEITLRNRGVEPCRFIVTANAYFAGDRETVVVAPGRERELHRSLRRSGRWYDFSVEVDGVAGFLRRFAGRVETGRDSLSDPALGGPARGDR
jgi:phospholipase C